MDLTQLPTRIEVRYYGKRNANLLELASMNADGNGYRVPSLYERFGTFFSSFGTPNCQ